VGSDKEVIKNQLLRDGMEVSASDEKRRLLPPGEQRGVIDNE
jgi:hypothetical protein